MNKVTKKDFDIDLGEFYDVKKGLPSYDSRRQSKLLFLSLFLLSAIFLSTIILAIGFLDIILDNLDIGGGVSIPSDYQIFIFLSFIFSEQVFLIGLLSLFAGILRALIFKNQLKSKFMIYVLVIISSGVIGGISAGVLSVLFELVHKHLVRLVPFLEPGLASILLKFFEGLLVGTLGGAIIGIIIAYAYIRFVGNSRYSRRYFIYTFFSWIILCGVGWSFGFAINDFLKTTFIGFAFGIFLILLADGIGFIAFLNLSPQIEFS